MFLKQESKHSLSFNHIRYSSPLSLPLSVIPAKIFLFSLSITSVFLLGLCLKTTNLLAQDPASLLESLPPLVAPEQTSTPQEDKAPAQPEKKDPLNSKDKKLIKEYKAESKHPEVLLNKQEEASGKGVDPAQAPQNPQDPNQPPQQVQQQNQDKDQAQASDALSKIPREFSFSLDVGQVRLISYNSSSFAGTWIAGFSGIIDLRNFSNGSSVLASLSYQSFKAYTDDSKANFDIKVDNYLLGFAYKYKLLRFNLLAGANVGICDLREYYIGITPFKDRSILLFASNIFLGARYNPLLIDKLYVGFDIGWNLGKVTSIQTLFHIGIDF